MVAVAGCACLGLGAARQQLRKPASRTMLPGAHRRAALRPARLNIANIASPPREPLTLPSVVPETALIDEVRSPT